MGMVDTGETSKTSRLPARVNYFLQVMGTTFSQWAHSLQPMLLLIKRILPY